MSHQDWPHRRCVPCEGGIPRLTRETATQWVQPFTSWSLSGEADYLVRTMTCRHFRDAMHLIQQIGELAEAEQHHPDLHVTRYRHVKIEITTHAIGGLSENDFILAAKIDALLESRS